MKHSLILGLLAAAATATATVVNAAEISFTLPPETSSLKAGDGVDLIRQQCALCHSVDYITTQPKLSRTTWTATLTKMQQKYGAPIPPDRTQLLIDYLTMNYGAEAATPATPLKK